MHERQQATTCGNIRRVHVRRMAIIDAIDEEIASIQRQQVFFCKKKHKEAGAFCWFREGAFSCFRENVANPIQKRVVYVRASRRRGPTLDVCTVRRLNLDQVGRFQSSRCSFVLTWSKAFFKYAVICLINLTCVSTVTPLDLSRHSKASRSTKQLCLVSGDLGFRSLSGFICDREKSPTRYLGQISEQICTSKRYKVGALPGPRARIALEENVWRTTKVSVFLGDFAHEEKLLTKLVENST